jgi:hypothetical protein
MNIQAKVFESAVVLADKATSLATFAAETLRERTLKLTDKADLKGAVAHLRTASGELHKIARQHGSRLVKQNASIAQAAGRDLRDLGRSVFANLAAPTKPAPRAARKTV